MVLPQAVSIDGSTANMEGIETVAGKPIELRQIKYISNRVEQDHRAIKRITRAMQRYKSCTCARVIFAGLETMHMIKKDQRGGQDSTAAFAADQLYSLAL